MNKEYLTDRVLIKDERLLLNAQSVFGKLVTDAWYCVFIPPDQHFNISLLRIVEEIKLCPYATSVDITNLQFDYEGDVVLKFSNGNEVWLESTEWATARLVDTKKAFYETNGGIK